MTNLTITKGYIIDDGGGGIDNEGYLSAHNLIVAQNNASWGGAAIFNNGTLTMTASLLQDNNLLLGSVDYTEGGALLNAGFATIISSTIAHNAATMGGGIFTQYGLNLDLQQSLIISNTATEKGGGIYTQIGPTKIVHSTISHNQATISGGGVYADFPPNLNMSYSTVAYNSAANGHNVGMRFGNINITHSIFVVDSGANCDLRSGNIISSHNIESGNSCGFTDPTDQVNTDPLLSPLGDYGGPTLTYLPLPFSPAIDRVPFGVDSCGTSITIDQRGVARPYETGCDIGAVELEVNYAPVAVSDQYSTSYNTTLTVITPSLLYNDSDGDWDSLQTYLLQLPTNGTVSLTRDGTFYYTPNVGFVGDDTFTYLVLDDQIQPIAHWMFDDQALTATDSSGNGHHALRVGSTYTNTIPVSATTGAYALAFDGNDYLEENTIPAALSGGTFSFGGWFYASPELGSHTMIAINRADYGNRIELRYDGTSNRIQYYALGGGSNVYESVQTMPFNQWTHVMVTVDADDMATLYINGVVDTTFVTGVDPQPGDRFSVGQEWDPGAVPSGFWYGRMDDIRVYDVALSAADVKGMMFSGEPRVGTTAVVTITVAEAQSGTLSGVIDLQGRLDESGPIVNVWNPIGALEATTTVNANGQYTLSVPTGNYTVTTVTPLYLDAAQTNVLIMTNSTTTLNPVTLLAGDINDDGYITIQDITVLLAGYATSCTTGNLVVNADLNVDCYVSILDLSLITGNFLKSEPIPWP